jgi:hypothetical protein
MNEETIGLHYIGLGLVLFLWDRFTLIAVIYCNNIPE